MVKLTIRFHHLIVFFSHIDVSFSWEFIGQKIQKKTVGSSSGEPSEKNFEFFNSLNPARPSSFYTAAVLVQEADIQILKIFSRASFFWRGRTLLTFFAVRKNSQMIGPLWTQLVILTVLMTPIVVTIPTGPKKLVLWIRGKLYTFSFLFASWIDVFEASSVRLQHRYAD